MIAVPRANEAAVLFVIVALGPRQRPSVAAFVQSSPQHVYIGPATASVLYSGDDYEEVSRLEGTGYHYIPFNDAASVEPALRDFPWRRGISYTLGYHIGLVPAHLLRVFLGTLSELMERAGCHIAYRHEEQLVHTVYLEHLSTPGPEAISLARERVACGARQRIFIGTGSVWDEAAMETTREFRELVAAMGWSSDGNGSVPPPPHVLRQIEYALAASAELRGRWQVAYRRALLRREQVLAFMRAPVMDGLGFWLDVAPNAFHNRTPWVGPPPIVPDGAIRGPYELHPGLLRLEPILDILMPSVGEKEIRFDGSFTATPPAIDDDPDEEGQIVVPAVCMSCVRIMPDFTPGELRRLRDPEHTGEVRLALSRCYKRPFNPCCYEAMMNPVRADVPTYDPLLYNVNPALPPPLSDMRTIIYTTHAAPSSLMWPTARLVWSSRTGTDVSHERTPVRRYLVRMGLPHVSCADYKFICRHPGGALDHMQNYHADGIIWPLNSPEVRPAPPASDIQFL